MIGLAFALEGIAFFVEAIFIGMYVYGWDRLPGRVHSLLLLPIVTAGIFGSFLVISVNGWMNAPTGFRVVDGEVVDVNPWAAIMNDAVWLQYLHMYLAAVMVVGYTVAGVYAVMLRRGHSQRIYRLGLTVPLVFAVVATPLQPLVGHFAGQVVADRQPIKLAAMEGLAETESGASLEIGGVFVDGELRGAVEVPVPGLLSFLAQNDFDAEVIGLDAVPPDERPPTGIVHLAYTTMIAIGTTLVGLAAWVCWHWWRRRASGPLTLGADAPDLADRAWLLRAVTAAGPAAIVAMETGWITTEVGRQPWIVHGVMRTEDAVTDASYIWWTLSGLIVLYSLLTVATVAVLISMSRRWAAGESLVTPYGPPEDVDAEATHHPEDQQPEPSTR